MAKQQTGMRLDAALLRKLKYIAWHDRRTFTTVLEMAAEAEIERWEALNQPITPEMLVNAKIVE